MPLVPKPSICDKHKIFRSIVELKLYCERCNREEPIKQRDLDKLEVAWPIHSHGDYHEFLSLIRRSKCPKCRPNESEVSETFKNGRLPLDWLPSTYDKRVFIGGNYQFISDLRVIKSTVHNLKSDFIPILPYDDFVVPYGEAYKTDLRLLHNCKYAIFDVTHPGGELFEIARCSEYGVTTLLVYQSRGSIRVPPSAETMLLESGNHEQRSYLDHSELGSIVKEFLLQKNPSQWQNWYKAIGFKFDEISHHAKIHSDGVTEIEMSFNGLTIDARNFELTQRDHSYYVYSGQIVPNTFRVDNDDCEWIRDKTKCTEQGEHGTVRFKHPLKKDSPPMSYKICLKTENEHIMTKQQLSKALSAGVNGLFLSSGMESESFQATAPTEKLRIQVQFPDRYRVTPQCVSYIGKILQIDGIKIPPDRFCFKNNIAELEVFRPINNYTYAITWEIPD